MKFTSKIITLSAVSILTFGCNNKNLDLKTDRSEHAIHQLNLENVPSELLEEPLKLADVIEIGLDHNPELRVTRHQLDAVGLQAKADRWNRLPDVKLGHRWRKRDSYRLQDYYNPKTGTPTVSDSVSEGRTHESSELVMAWNVINTGIAHYQSKRSNMMFLLRKLELVNKQQHLIMDLTKSFWEAAVSEDALDYLSVTETELKRQKQSIDKALMERSIDAIRAKESQKRLVDLGLSIHKIQMDISNARLLVAQLMGVSPMQSFKLERSQIKPILAAMPLPSQLDIDQLQRITLLNRFELYQMDMEKLISQDEVRMNLLQMFPILSFEAGVYHDDNDLLINNSWANAGYNVTWNLLKLPSQYQAYKQSERLVKVKEAERRAMSMTVLAQLHISLLDFSNKVKRFKILEESSDLAQELLKMTQTKYRSGKTTEYEVSKRLMEDVSAKLERDRAVVEVIVAYKRLLLTMGVDPNAELKELNELNIFKKPSSDQKAESEKEAKSKPKAATQVEELKPKPVVEKVNAKKGVPVKSKKGNGKPKADASKPKPVEKKEKVKLQNTKIQPKKVLAKKDTTSPEAEKKAITK